MEYAKKLEEAGHKMVIWGNDPANAKADAEVARDFMLDILDDLSDVIDEARETNDQDERAELYQEAMGYVLDLAIELPVYQRDVLYAYNANVINPDSLPSDINPYSSPLDRIWELEFAN